jgi:hypothetical protein
VNQLAQYTMISEVTKAIEITEEIRRFQRYGVWKPLADRYSALAIVLIKIKSHKTKLDDGENKVLQSAVTFSRRIEKEIDKALSEGDLPSDAAKLNALMAKSVDGLSSLLGRLQMEYQQNDKEP